MPLRTGLHRRDKGHFMFRTSPAFSRSFTAQIGVSHFNSAAEYPALCALEHNLHDFMLELPGRVVADSQFAREL